MDGPSPQFDVFFSYHGSDHAAVESVARRLTAGGLRVFLDRWYLVAGQPWPQALERSLAICDAVAVFLGPSGMGSWQQREKDLALHRQAREAGFPVIPVLLPGSNPALDFLGLNTWVDLRAGLDDSRSLSVLEAGIRRRPFGPEMQLQIDETLRSICPYRGLQPFREEDALFFCGREAPVQELVTAVERQPFVALVGSSGSGKSSVIRAGLIPALRAGTLQHVWDVATLVPTGQPLHSLAAALMLKLAPERSEVDRLAEVKKLAEHLVDGSIGLSDVAARCLSKQPGTDRLLLFIDQWEELYTLCRDVAQRSRFIDEVLGASADGAIHVVLTMRGDFFGQALSDRAFADRLRNAQVNLSAMTPEELHRSIIEPAQTVGLTFEPGLVDRVVKDVGDNPGNLPLLEFVLTELWERRQGGTLRHDAYEAIGALTGAIAARADETFDRLDSEQKPVARHLLVQLVRPGEGTEDSRQRAPLPHADTVALAVVRRLADARLLVTMRDETTGEETVELAHEALIRNWSRLRSWVDADREFLRSRARLETAAALWDAESQDATRLLSPGRPLGEGEEALAHRRADLSSRVIAFVEASAAQARRRRHRWLLVAGAVMASLAVLAVTASWFGYNATLSEHAALAEKARADRARDRAQTAELNARRQRDEVLRTQSVFLADLSRRELERGNDRVAVLLALEALPQQLSDPDRPYVRQAETALYRAVDGNREEVTLQGHEGHMFSAAFSPDAKTVVTASRDGTARLWDAETGRTLHVLEGPGRPGWPPPMRWAAFSPDGRPIIASSLLQTGMLWNAETGELLHRLEGHELDIYRGAFSPDGKEVVTASADGTARLWDTGTGEPLQTLAHDDEVRSAVFSPDGRRVLTASKDHTARIWQADTGEVLHSLVGHDDTVNYAAFSSDGQQVVTASDDHTARIWRADTGQLLHSLLGHTDAVHYAAFSPDGRQVISASEDKTARFWDAETGELLHVLKGHSLGIFRATFSPDGAWVVTGAADATVRLWRVDTGEAMHVLSGHEDWISDVSFSIDGKRILSASADGTARLWSAAPGEQNHVLVGHMNPVSCVAFSPDGRRVATSSWDGTARLWDSETGAMHQVLTGHEGWIFDVAFSPDGRRIVTGSRDATARVWDAEGGRTLQVLSGHEGPVFRAAFSPDGSRIFTASEDSVRVWDANTGEALHVLAAPDHAIRNAAFSFDGRRIVTASHDKTARLWDAETGAPLQSLIGHGDSALDATFSHDGRSVVTISADGTARLWDAETGDVIHVFEGHDALPLHAVFSPDDELIATASADTMVRIWDAQTGALVHVLPAQAVGLQRIGAPVFDPAGERIAMASVDNSVRVWDVESAEVLATLSGHEGNVYHVVFSPDGRRLASASHDGTARVWPVLPGGQALIDLARNQVPQPLTGDERRRYFLAAD